MVKKSTKNKTVLVVEDERPLLEAIKSKLELNKFDVVCARTVDQALSYLEDIDKINIIWLDHYLFGQKDGLDFVAKLKDSNSKWKDIPIVVVSNSASLDKEQIYLNLGVNNYYTKANYSLSQIINDINNFFRAK